MVDSGKSYEKIIVIFLVLLLCITYQVSVYDNNDYFNLNMD